MKLSVVLPTYDEAGNIVQLVQALLWVLPETFEPEILVVDDNSPDGTFRLVVDRFKGDPRVVPILRTTDRGFAKSIRAGIERATGEQIVVMDTDFTHDPEELPRLLHVAQVFDLVIGSRFCAGGSMQDVTHYLASLFYNWTLRVILRTQVQDNLGGYFTGRRELLLGLPLDEIFFGYGDYFFRLIFFLEQRGYALAELPSHYRARKAGVSKSRFFGMLFSYTRAAVRLRMRHERKSPAPAGQ